MRAFEATLWFVSAAAVAWWIVHGRGRVVAVPAALIGIFGVHVLSEGARLPMAPTYILSVVASIGYLLNSRASGRLRPHARWALAVPAIAFIALAAVLPLVFPVFSYDEPSGPYAVGTALYEVREGGRDLPIQAWYPVDRSAKGQPAGISPRTDLLESAYASLTGLPKPLFDSLRLVRTHAIQNARPANQGPFPVILFSHGPGAGNRSQSIFQMEALASHGFVTIAIDHTGYASTAIFPDGRAVPYDPAVGWPALVDEKSTAMVKVWVRDVSFVIDRLEALNAGDASGLLTGVLDLSKIGYAGASFGGSVVVQSLLSEPRIKAGVAEDGKPYYFDEVLSGLARPLMYMQSAQPYIPVSDAQLARWGLTQATFREAEQDHYARQMLLFGRGAGPIYNVYIRATDHITFSDLYLMIRLPDLQRMDIHRAHRIINDYTVAFFDRYLRGTASSLVDGMTASPYPEVTVASRNVASGLRAEK